MKMENASKEATLPVIHGSGVPAQAAVSQEDLASCGVTSASDLSIPKIMLMQSTSENVGAGKAKLGDVINTHTGATVGGEGEPLVIVPLKLVKLWKIDDMSDPKNKRGKFLRHDPVTPKNEKLPWEDVENGIPIRRTLCMDFFCLLVSELDTGEAFPVAIRFKRTSMEAGRMLATVMAKNLFLRRPSYYRTVYLEVVKKQQESNWYAVFTARTGEPLNDGQLKQAAELFDLTRTLTYNPDEGEADDTEPSAFEPETVSAPQTVGGEQADMF